MDGMELVKGHEGVRLRCYVDTRGKRSIGFGRNLDDNGVTLEEALMLFSRDYTDALNEALKFPWYAALSAPRQAVIVDMVFNMGPARVLKFKRTIAAIEAGDFELAAAEMLNSAWAGEVGVRAREDAGIMNSGAWPVS